jgi:hypothetical protein
LIKRRRTAIFLKILIIRFYLPKKTDHNIEAKTKNTMLLMQFKKKILSKFTRLLLQ